MALMAARYSAVKGSSAGSAVSPVTAATEAVATPHPTLQLPLQRAKSDMQDLPQERETAFDRRVGRPVDNLNASPRQIGSPPPRAPAFCSRRAVGIGAGTHADDRRHAASIAFGLGATPCPTSRTVPMRTRRRPSFQYLP